MLRAYPGFTGGLIEQAGGMGERQQPLVAGIDKPAEQAGKCLAGGQGTAILLKQVAGGMGAQRDDHLGGDKGEFLFQVRAAAGSFDRFGFRC